MKRELLFLIGLSSAIYATQEISCVEFVNFNKNDAQNYLDNYRKDFKLNHFKTKNITDVDKTYIGFQGGVSKHLLTCIDLRKITYYGVEDVRRALILTSLSKKSLSGDEENIYRNSLDENIRHYKRYSKSSLFNAESMPLVYLTIERSKDNRSYILYEFRKNGVEIKRYSKKIAISQPYIHFNNSNKIANQDYLNYLNGSKIVPNLRQYASPAPRVSKPIISNKPTPLEEEYEVIKTFQANKVSDNKKNKDVYDITNKDYPIKIREQNGKVYFKLDSYDTTEYVASKRWWEDGTKKIGGFQ